MDRFKHLVDTHGHVRGSAALAEVGRWLHGELADGEIVCRFGGDEFALLFPSADRVAAEARCLTLGAASRRGPSSMTDGIHARLGASLGRRRVPTDGRTPSICCASPTSALRVEARPRDRARLRLSLADSRLTRRCERLQPLP